MYQIVKRFVSFRKQELIMAERADFIFHMKDMQRHAKISKDMQRYVFHMKDMQIYFACERHS